MYYQKFSKRLEVQNPFALKNGDTMCYLCLLINSTNGTDVSQWRALTPANAMNQTDGWQAKLVHVSGFVSFLDPSIQYWARHADVIIPIGAGDPQRVALERSDGGADGA